MVAFVKWPFAVSETAFLFRRNRLLLPRVATSVASRGCICSLAWLQVFPRVAAISPSSGVVFNDTYD